MTSTSMTWQADPVRLPKAAEIVTQDLRRRIAHGEFGEGDVLPSGLELMRTYQVSRPTLREAYRVLESEKLIVRSPRNRAVFHIQLPSPTVAARYAGLLLQLRGATVADVAGNRNFLEASMAGLLAAAHDERALTRLAEAKASGDYHALVVDLAGNTTLRTIVGLLDSILDRHGSTRPRECADRRAHTKLGRLVAAGDVEAATSFWREHLGEAAGPAAAADEQTVIELFGRDQRDRRLRPAEELAATLRHQIVRGELADGEWLPTEPELREAHHVSRMILREALRILESEGLVTVHRGARGGATIAHPSPGSIARYFGLLLQTRGTTMGDFLRARMVLEPPLAGMVAAHHAPEAIEALQHAFNTEARALGNGNPGAFGQNAVAFHETLAEHSGSPTLTVSMALLDSVLQQVAKLRLSQADEPARSARAHAEHAELLERIKAGDVRGADELWRAHSRPAAQSLLQGDQLDLIDLFARD